MSVGAVGADQRTPNLAAVGGLLGAQLVNRGGWSSGNALAIIITGTGKRIAEAYDGEPSAAPLLHIGYSGGGGGNPNPTPTPTSTQTPGGGPTPTPIPSSTALYVQPYILKYYSPRSGSPSDQRIAMRENGTLRWLLDDHLGSTSLTATGTTETGEVRYFAWGKARYSSGTTPTSFKFTGQREESSLGLLD